jgi:mono/diheme cytochrome c family protein
MLVRVFSTLAFTLLALTLSLGCGGGGKKDTTTPAGGGDGVDATGGDNGGGTANAGGGVTAGDASKGASVFADACSTCHGDQGEGSKKTPAVVGAGSLKKFDSDTALFEYLKKEMPKDDPGSLSDQEYTDVIAWMRSK